MNNIIQRREAKAILQHWYFTGKPCKYGHIDKRKTINGSCLACDSIVRKSREDKDRRNKVNQEYRKKLGNDIKLSAHSKVKNEIRQGRMVKLSCCICKNAKSHAHHDDYSKPLDVIWLCALHHKHRHMELTAIKQLVKGEV